MGGRADHTRGLGDLRGSVGSILQRACMHAEQRQPVRQESCISPRDAVALGLARPFGVQALLGLLSSHLLREVQATADRLVIIGDGRIVAQGSTKDLLSGAGTLVVADDESGLMAALAAADLVARTLPDGGFMVDAEPEAVGRAAVDGGVALSHLGPSEATTSSSCSST